MKIEREDHEGRITENLTNHFMNQLVNTAKDAEDDQGQLYDNLKN